MLAGKLDRFKPGTVRLIYATIRRMLTRAVFDGVINDNPATSVWRELPTPVAKRRTSRCRSRNEVPAMSEEQLTAFLANAARYRSLFETLAYTGCASGRR